MTGARSRLADSPADSLTFHITSRAEDLDTCADTQAIFYWQGRYHFHYYGGNGDDAYGHISSPDLVHWTWHPTTLSRSVTGHGITSGGGFLTKEGRPAIIYGSVAKGETMVLGPAQIVQALDDQLESWSAPTPVEPRAKVASDLDIVCPFDPCGWLEGDTYYALFADPPKIPLLTEGKPKKATVHKSTDLRSWEFVGPFLTTDLPETEDDWDISCPDFFPIGKEHMLLCISHNMGCRYYLGEWKDEKFTPTRHGRMNWQQTPQVGPHHIDVDVVDPGPRLGGWAVFFAPESFLTPDGRRVMWAWCWIIGLQKGIQSLPRELSLPDDGILRIAPLRELETLRTDQATVSGIDVPPDGISVVPGVSGDALECSVTFRPGSAHRFGITVLCDATGHDGLPITVDAVAGTVAVGDTAAPFEPASDEVTLRVFVDKAMVEVFADDRQAVIGAHPHPPENTHVGLFADDRATADLVAWHLSSIYTDAPTAEDGEHQAAGLQTEGSARS